MLEMEWTGPGQARLLEDKQPIGHARWDMKFLAWGKEQVKVAAVEEFQSPQDRRGDLWAYLTFLFQRDGAAAAVLDGTFFWFSQALQASWQAAGSPRAFSHIEP